MSGIAVRDLSKRFGSVSVLDRLSFDFPADTVTCLLGPSGCGKTTLLRLIAGLERPDGGAILLGGADLVRLPPRQRNLAMVFQYPVTYPTLSVADNIREPLRHDRSLSPALRERRVEEVLDILALGAVAGRRARELDAGGRQRVAVGRAVARHCPVLLFDEPTTNIELAAKLQLMRAFKQITRRLKQTIVYVTHDQTEAMTVADRIALMQDGRILQCDTPRLLYERPETEFGGWFLGNPGMSFLSGVPGPDGMRFALLPDPVPGAPPLTLGVRPEHLLVAPAPFPGSVAATVTARTVGIGGVVLLTLDLGDTQQVRAKVPPGSLFQPGAAVHVACAPGRAALFRDGVRLALPSSAPALV